MALIVKELYRKYYTFEMEMKVTPIDHYPLLGSPLKAVSVVAFYLYFVKTLGPKIMENRKPYEIKNFMIFYNGMQVLMNSILGVFALATFFGNDYNWLCLTTDVSDTPRARKVALLSYAYYIIKMIDLTDTIIFVLRKKTQQITFLHVYHHITISLGSYIHSRYMPSGHSSILGVVNTWVHVFMYAYYFVAAFRPDLKSSLWWKKHLTQVQITQFSFLMVHFGHPLLFGNCSYSKFWLMFCTIQNACMLVMFIDFYIKAYVKKSKKIN